MPRTFRVPQSTKRRDSINQPLTLSSFIFFSFPFSFPPFSSFSLIPLPPLRSLRFHGNPTLFLPLLPSLFLPIKLPVKSSYFFSFSVSRGVRSSSRAFISRKEITILLVLLHPFANSWIHWALFLKIACTQSWDILFVLSPQRLLLFIGGHQRYCYD